MMKTFKPYTAATVVVYRNTVDFLRRMTHQFSFLQPGNLLIWKYDPSGLKKTTTLTLTKASRFRTYTDSQPFRHFWWFILSEQ